MLILQVVGYKNSGKTTLVSEFIKTFSNKGLQVASLKHHGHGGKPASVKNTDTSRHEQAGAVMTGVEGGGQLQLSIYKPLWEMDQLLAFYQWMETDLLIIEGYKQHDFDKVVLLRDEQDVSLLEELTNIQAVVADVPLERVDYPVFKRSEHGTLSEWLEENWFIR